MKNICANMSSKSLENYDWKPRSPSDRILTVLKMHGELTAADIGQKLGITKEAARQHLVRLGDEGEVREEMRTSGGRGRPSSYWCLTPSGYGRFPDTHANLTVEIIDTIRSALGEPALEAVISQRERQITSIYRAAIPSGTGLEERIAVLTRLRVAEGYMAEWEPFENGAFIFIENHCPICAAARSCLGFCRSELEMFKSILGNDVLVERSEHLLSGGRRCAYVIREMAQNS